MLNITRNLLVPNQYNSKLKFVEHIVSTEFGAFVPAKL